MEKLLERTNAGLTVEVIYGNDNLVLSVIDGDMSPIIFPIEKDCVFDAFDHPFFYMPKPDHETWKIAKRERQLADIA